MAALPKHFSAPRKADRLRRVWIPVIILAYELVFLLFGLFMVMETWPGNRCSADRFFIENHPRLLAEVQAASTDKLQRARLVLARWRIQGPADLSARDLKDVSEGLALASEFVTNSISTNLVTTTILTRLQIRTNNRYFTNSTSTGKPQLSSRTTVTTNIYTTNSSNLPVIDHAVVLPTSGDLRRLTLRSLTDAAEKLDAAMALLQRRSGLFKKFSQIETPGSFWDRFRPSTTGTKTPEDGIELTPSERVEYQIRADSLLATQGATRFCSKAFDLLVLLMAFGAIGGAIQALASIGVYLGNQRFASRWTAFYFVRPLAGAIMALVFYFLLAARLMTLPSSLDGDGTMKVVDISSINVCSAIALLVGLFSGEAMEKLRQTAAGLLTSNKAKDAFDDETPFIYAPTIEAFAEFTPDNIQNLEQFASELKPKPPPEATPPSGGKIPPPEPKQPPGHPGPATGPTLASPPLDPTPPPAGGQSTSPPTSSSATALLSAFLFHRLSKATQLLLAEHKGPATIKLQQALAADLNRIVQTEEIYDPCLFSKIPLSREIQERASRHPRGPELVAQNIELLLEAYSNVLAPPNLRWQVTLHGTNFKPDSTVYIDGSALTGESKARFLEQKTLCFDLQSPEHFADAKLAAAVLNPGSKGGFSEAVELVLPSTFSRITRPGPRIHEVKIEPTQEPLGWKVSLLGAHFRPNSLVRLNDADLPADEIPQVVNDQTITIALKRSNHQPGKVSLVVCTPDPDNGRSNPFEIEVPDPSGKA